MSDGFRLIDKKWGAELEALTLNPDQTLRIICPFIKLSALNRLLIGVQSQKIEVITRYNLQDFASGVSDISALRALLKRGANIKGLKNLHTKLYLFDSSQAVLTSANLTKSAFDRNHEFGFVSDSQEIISECQKYFDGLWAVTSKELKLQSLDEWEQRIVAHKRTGSQKKKEESLEDFGADYREDNAFSDSPPAIAEARQAFVKFQGSSHDRASLSNKIIDHVDGGGCHWALTYKKKCRIVKNDAVMFIAAITEDGMRIYGRAIGKQFEESKDVATNEEISVREWKKEYPYYIRVHGAEFISGTLNNAVSLSTLMDELKENSFASTKRRAEEGKTNIRAAMSLGRQPAVQLSTEGFKWLNEKFELALKQKGKIPTHVLDELDWPNLNAHYPSFTVKLGKTYFNEGYFNPPKEFSDIIDGGNITILLGVNRQKIEKSISRIYKANDCVPRIDGGSELRDWFQGNFLINDKVKVIVENSKTLLLLPNIK